MFVRSLLIPAIAVVAILVGLTSAHAAVVPINIAGFDPDAGGDDAAFTLSSVDTNTGNSLGRGGVTAFGTGVGGTFNLFYHTSISAFNNETGADQSGLDLGARATGADYEYTLVVGFGEVIANITTVPGIGTFATFDINGAAESWYELWYDDGSVAGAAAYNNLTGEGFRDGELVLSATAIAGRTTFLNSDTHAGGPDTHTDLDQFPGGNHYTGQETIRGNGAANDLTFLIDGYNSNFFTLGLSPLLIHLALFDTQVSIPFNQQEPSDGFYDTDSGLTASAGVTAAIAANRALGASLNGAGTGASTLGTVNGEDGPDIQLQTDGSFSFAAVPEPSSMVLWGVGALVLGAVRRRHRKLNG
jgi:hypothetical protein